MSEDESDFDKLEDAVKLVLISKLMSFASEKKKNRKKRSCWRKKWIERREMGRGSLHLVHGELAQEDPAAYTNYLRMNEQLFEKLLSMIDEKIRKKDTNMRECISSRDKLTVTLRFLATGNSYADLAYQTRIAACTISKFVPEVCDALYTTLKEDYMKVPSMEEEWEKVAFDFQSMWNYPNCLGAMDGRHIAFRPPRSAGSTFYNYKGFHSIVLLALVDANYRFIYIDAGVNGRVSDGGVYRDSQLATAVSTNSINIPPPKPLPNREMPVPYVIVADDAFSLSEHIMKPYPLRNLAHDKRIHNYRLSRARRVSENAFGILANRFRIFLSPINLGEEKVKLITKAACALHNFLRSETMATYMPPEYVDFDGPEGSVIPGAWRMEHTPMARMRQQGGNHVPCQPMRIRDEFKDYFNNEGKVSWQEDYA